MLTGPRASGKTTLAARRAATVVRLDADAQAAAFIADPGRSSELRASRRTLAWRTSPLLTQLLVVDQLPAWASNRLKRLIRAPKRYVVDAALLAAALRLDTQGVLDDGNVLGRLLDTSVVAQIRPETVVAECEPRLHHLRTESGRHEVDVVAELGGRRVIGIEVKAGATATASDARHLQWLRDELGARFVAGVVLHTGPRLYQLSDRIVAAPISVLWGWL
jgi:hypothetical protein